MEHIYTGIVRQRAIFKTGSMTPCPCIMYLNFRGVIATNVDNTNVYICVFIFFKKNLVTIRLLVLRFAVRVLRMGAKRQQ
jgi:hypothetical protein